MGKIILLIALLWLCPGTQAQVPETTDSLKQISLDELTISVTRFAENKKFLAQQVHSISAKKIAFYNQQTTAELLTHTGNVFIQKSQLGGGSPVIRGFEANKVLISIDGVRMNNAIYRGGHLQNVLTMDNAILEKTEILFGPASVMYGSDALGGVISFYTKNPVLSKVPNKTVVSGTAFTRYASAYNEKTGHVNFSIGGKNIGSLTSFTFSDFGDLRQGSRYFTRFPDWGKRTFYVEHINGKDSIIANKNPSKQVQTGYKQYDLLQKILFNTGNFTHSINLQYSTSSNIFRYDRLIEMTAAGLPRSAQWYYGPQQRLMAAWNLKLPAGTFYDKAQIILSYQNIEESRHNRNFRSTILNHRIENVQVGILNADFFKKIARTEFSYGTEINYNDVGSKAYAENITSGLRSPLDTRYPDGGSKTQSFAAYGTVLHKFSDKIIFNAGMRHTAYRLSANFKDTTFFPFPFKNMKQKNDALSGNLGLVFLPGADWKISLLLASGFRAPNVDDATKVFESGGGTLIVPNPGIRPEKTINYELGITKNLKQKLQLSSCIWYTKYSDILTTDFSTFNGSPTIIYNGQTSSVVTLINKKNAYSWGVGGNVTAEINKYFSFSSNINYTYGRIKEQLKDYPLDHIPPIYGKISLTGRFGKLTSELFSLYNGTKDSSDYNLRGEDNQVYSADVLRGYTPSWITTNLRLAYEISPLISCQLAVENISDKFYRVFGSGLSAPGRNIVLTLRAKL